MTYTQCATCIKWCKGERLEAGRSPPSAYTGCARLRRPFLPSTSGKLRESTAAHSQPSAMWLPVSAGFLSFVFLRQKRGGVLSLFLDSVVVSYELHKSVVTLGSAVAIRGSK